MSQIKDCPHCGAEGALETNLRIDLDDVVVENGEVVSFILAGSSNDPSNGLVVEEATVSCRDCGHVLDALVPMRFTDRWTYSEPNPRMAKATELCHLLNRGWKPRQALESLGFDPDAVFSEDPGLDLDDDGNAVVDLGDEGGDLVIYMQRHADRWHVHTVRR